MRISIVGIGTELTSGQIINKNASWISKKMKALGIPTSFHLTVPDNRALMLRALQVAAEQSDIIFVTGGLGPTTDDFTREVVSEWAGRRLVWDESSWKFVQERLSSRGFPIHDFQKQQCYFPEGSNILINNQGTAHGFQLEAQGIVLFVLPGPPREIEAIWRDGIAGWLAKKISGLDQIITRSWDTMGYGESEVANLTETALKGSNLEIGYRVHLPYVEVKVSFLKSQEKNVAGWLKKLDASLGPMTMLRNGEDAAENLFLSLPKQQALTIFDEVSGSFLLNRLEPFLRSQLNSRKFLFENARHSRLELLEISASQIVLFIERIDENTVRIGLVKNRNLKETTLSSPIRSPLMAERRQQYFAEIALMFWAQQLRP